MTIGVHTCHRGIKTLLPSVLLLSRSLLVEQKSWLCHARFSQYHHKVHLTRTDPRSVGGCYELKFGLILRKKLVKLLEKAGSLNSYSDHCQSSGSGVSVASIVTTERAPVDVLF